MGTLKVLDNTAISAILFEIGSIDVLSGCCRRYDVLTSPTIMAELKASKRSKIRKDHGHLIKVEEPNIHDPTPLVKNPVKRYPSLHEGELSAYLVALHRSVATGEPVVFVSDDNTMRREASSGLGQIQISFGFIAPWCGSAPS